MTYDEVVAALTGPGGAFEFCLDPTTDHSVRRYKDAPSSMRALLEASANHGDRPFVCYQDEVHSFRDNYRRAAALAHYLLEQGIRKGDRVAVGMRNYPEWPVAFWACQAIGAVVVALNGWWTTLELQYAFEDAEPVGLIVDGEIYRRVEPLLASARFKTVIVTRDESPVPPALDLSVIVAEPCDRLPDATIDEGDIATILYTSGTTGKPKGAIGTHANHVSTMMNVRLVGALNAERDGATAPPVAPCSLQAHPIFHVGGMGNMYLSTYFGIKLLLMYKWDAAEAVRLARIHRPTMVTGVPIQMRQFIECAHESGADLRSIVNITVGGAPVTPDLVRRITGDLGASPWNGYGLTETTGAFMCNVGQEYLANMSSVGRPIPSCEVRFVDGDGEDCTQGEIGELLTRGPNVISGYWNRPEETESTFAGGWFRTGDMGYRADDGLCYLVDRKKDVVIRGGENIYSVEVEAEIFTVAGVRDVAVFGIPDEQYGEQVCAVVKIDEARAGEPHVQEDFADRIRTALDGRLARFKIPAVVHVTIEDLPRSATGKVLKRDLRERYAPALASA